MLQRWLSWYRALGAVGLLRYRAEALFGAGKDKHGEHAWPQLQAAQELGRGKDGISWLGEDAAGKAWVVKQTSEYGRQWLARSEAALGKHCGHTGIAEVEYRHDSWRYPFLALETASSQTKPFLQQLISLCELQVALLRGGYIYWDWGNAQANYRVDAGGQVHLIDYGGNAFLPLHGDAHFPKHCWRESLRKAEHSFIYCQLLLHIACFALGRQQGLQWAQYAQYSPKAIKLATDWAERELRGTAFAQIISWGKNQNSLCESAWENLADIAQQLLSDNSEVQEAADIDSVRLLPSGVEVRGYQAYDIIDGVFTPLPKDTLWSTEEKAPLVEKVLADWAQQSPGASYRDIGCNLGLYVLLAKIRYQFGDCKGVDYNGDYIDQCRVIAEHLGHADLDFQRASFDDCKEATDYLSMLGLIHHLYQRTAGHGELASIVEHIASLCRHAALIEFPTERDAKAAKWTQLPGRPATSPYSEAEFLSCAERHFHKISRLGKASDERPLYLLEK